jgi:hypothetical protein
VIRELEDTKDLEKLGKMKALITSRTAGMTSAEENDYYSRKARHLFADTGDVPQCVNLSGQGKLKPRVPEAVGK